MREILFRGKRKDNGEWVYGFYFEEIGSFIKEKPSSVSTNTYLVTPETIGQYTGLTDKNGKKIFEGDIIQSLKLSVTGLVQWFPEHSAFMVWCKSANEVGFLYECADIIKVISNIYDNPEMLKGGAE